MHGSVALVSGQFPCPVSQRFSELTQYPDRKRLVGRDWLRKIQASLLFSMVIRTGYRSILLNIISDMRKIYLSRRTISAMKVIMLLSTAWDVIDSPSCSFVARCVS